MRDARLDPGSALRAVRDDVKRERARRQGIQSPLRDACLDPGSALRAVRDDVKRERERGRAVRDDVERKDIVRGDGERKGVVRDDVFLFAVVPGCGTSALGRGRSQVPGMVCGFVARRPPCVFIAVLF